MVADVVIAAVARRFAAANETVIVDKRYSLCVKVFQQI
jgi:hypothetical protein